MGRQRREVVPATAQRGSEELAAPQGFNEAPGAQSQ